MISVASPLVALLTVAGTASALVINKRAVEPVKASFKLQWPATRGNTAQTQYTGPCQGFPVGTITDFPITGGKLAFTQTGVIDDVQVAFAPLADFSSVTAESTFTDILPEVDDSLVGHHCYVAPDFSSSFGTAVGQNVTLQIEYTQRDTGMKGYECADVHLVEAAAFAASGTTVSLCFNATTADTAIPTDSVHANLTASASASASAAAVALNESNGLTAAQGGGIGAGVGIAVTLAVVAAILLLLSKTGRATFGKQAAAPQLPPMVQKKMSFDTDESH